MKGKSPPPYSQKKIWFGQGKDRVNKGKNRFQEEDRKIAGKKKMPVPAAHLEGGDGKDIFAEERKIFLGSHQAPNLKKMLA